MMDIPLSGWRRLSCVAMLSGFLALLVACGGNTSTSSNTPQDTVAPDMASAEPTPSLDNEAVSEPSSAAPLVTQPGPVSSAEPTVSASCAWLASIDPGLINIFYPDKDAIYWLTVLPAVPGTEYIIEGRYPDARYFSFNSYDAIFRPVDAVTDVQIEPLAAGHNPFTDHTAVSGGDYRIAIRLEDVPEQREPNTLYVGGLTPSADGGLPTSSVTILYRIYVPEGDLTGKVGMPQISLAVPGSDQSPLGFSRCELLNLPVVNEINQLAKEMPNLLPVPGINMVPLTETEPQFRKFFGVPNLLGTLIEIASPVDLSLSENIPAEGGGFLSNIDNAYVFSQYTRDKGNSYILRAKAPSHRPGANGEPAQVRYWSLCTNHFVTTRFVSCLRDEEIPLDEEGFFTLVVSDINNKPDNARDENGIAWLPWGSIYTDSVFIYRHMLPDDSFTQSVQSIEFGDEESEVMGEFYPLTVYCNKATIEAAGNRASDVFDACVNAGPGRPFEEFFDPFESFLAVFE